MIRLHLVCVASILCLASLAVAQDGEPELQEVRLDKSAATDLYIKKRPAVPTSPKLPDILNERLLIAEASVNDKRDEAIGLLRSFLNTKPTGAGRSEGLFKLAELLWEDSRRQYLVAMDRFDSQLESCRQIAGSCSKPPKEPRLTFAESEQLYRLILADHPNFRRTDLVLYLVGFAAQEDGRQSEALQFFAQVVERFPTSPLFGDSWLMIGEHYFVGEKWDSARDAYTEVLSHPEAEGYDLALFKSAWCDWKLGDTDAAAKRFKLVLDLAAEAEKSGTDLERKRRSQLRDEALNYLVLVFTEDPSIKARDVFEFLASIGGEQYSKSVVVRLADVFYDQGDYDRSIEAFRFLIHDNPSSIKAATYQRKIVDAYQEALLGEKAMAELKLLVHNYAPDGPWAKENSSHKKAVLRAYRNTELLVRNMAKGFHSNAQELEGTQKRVDKQAYQLAVDTYGFYLENFAKDNNAGEIRFLYAEILFFKMNKAEQAGDQYLLVGKSTPKGKWHKDALLKAMAAYRKLRPKNISAGRRELLPVDRKFAEATDVYATLFPADPKLVGVIFENGELFYEYGDYDEAIKRFGLIVTKYPDHQNAGAAGDRILDSLNKAEDYENIEEWARKLRKAKGFQSDKQQARLDRLIVESIGKSGEKYAAAGEYDKAANFYLRVGKEFPDNELTPQSTFNAAVLLEKAKKPKQAADTYLSVSERHPKHQLAQLASFTGAAVYESMAYFEKAAESYERTVKKFPKGEKMGDALFNAGVLRQALGQNKRAIKHYQQYANTFRKSSKKEASEVAFQIAVVHQQAGNEAQAEKAYKEYLRGYKNGSHKIEAMVFAGRSAYKQRHYRDASKQLEAALKEYKRLKGETALRNRPYAAEARYYEGELLYRKYAKISLDVKPRKLDKTLKQKMKLLEQASEVYLDVVEYKNASWATAALFRIGSVMEEFSNSLRDAPIPKGFSDAEAEQYREALDNEVITIEERAIELYTTGYAKAIELKVYNEFTKKLRSALGRMAASQYPPAKEVRQARRLGDRPPSIAMSKEVVRDE